jgi:hypothetical protein
VYHAVKIVWAKEAGSNRMLKKNCIMKSCMMFIYCQVLLGDQMEVYVIGRACGIYRGEGKGIQGGRRNMKKRTALKI